MKRPKFKVKPRPNLTPVLLRVNADSENFASAQALSDELFRFLSVLDTVPVERRNTDRYVLTVAAVTDLLALLECQRAQTFAVLPLSGPRPKR